MFCCYSVYLYMFSFNCFLRNCKNVLYQQCSSSVLLYTLSILLVLYLSFVVCLQCSKQLIVLTSH